MDAGKVPAQAGGGGGSGTTADQIQGNVAHSDPDLGNPVKIGWHARSTPMADVAQDDRVDAMGTLQGDGWMYLRHAIAGEQPEAAVNALAQIQRVYAANLHLPSVAASISTTGGPSLVVKASSGNLYHIIVTNITAGLLYLHIQNRTAYSTAGVVPEVPAIAVGGNSTVEVDWTNLPVHFTTGISIGLSTSAFISVVPGNVGNFWARYM